VPERAPLVRPLAGCVVTWFKVDDTLAFHHKVVAAGNGALGLWVRAGAMCSQQLTDGFVADHMVAAMDGKRLAPVLVAVGLWTKVEGGYQFHEWEQANPTREQVENERATARERMQKLRSGSRGVRANKPRTSEEVLDPDPSLASKEAIGAQKRGSNGTRLKPDWMPDPLVRSQMTKERPDVDQKSEHQKFVDYWTAKTGRDATKLDWNATWRNWIRNAKGGTNGTKLQAVPAYVSPPERPLPGSVA
jgi:hypothetical protein